MSKVMDCARKSLMAHRQGDKLFVEISATVEEGCLRIRRECFPGWNPFKMEHEVEDYVFDRENTERLYEIFGTHSTSRLMQKIEGEFGRDGIHFFISDMKDFCEERGVGFAKL